jgi:DNA invertase Pin-like site-specific DNA recombinase
VLYFISRNRRQHGTQRTEKATAYYVRVSSKTQDMRSQIPDLETHACAQSGRVRWYKDAFTGTEMDRPGSEQLMKDLRAGLIGQIVIWRLDRLGRTTAELVNLLDELRDLKVGLVSLRDGSLDPTTPTGRLIYTILSSVAAYETEVRKERQMAGIQAVRNRNAGKCPWGGSQPGRRLRVTEQKEELIKRLRQEGKRITSIAALVGLSKTDVLFRAEKGGVIRRELGGAFPAS